MRAGWPPGPACARAFPCVRAGPLPWSFAAPVKGCRLRPCRS